VIVLVLDVGRTVARDDAAEETLTHSASPGRDGRRELL
jgi:hypothetical protein